MIAARQHHLADRFGVRARHDLRPHAASTAAPPHAQRRSGAIRQILWRSSVFVAVLIACSLVQASHALYYGFSTIDWTTKGLSDTAIGSLWALGVIAEILLFAASGFLSELIEPLSVRGDRGRRRNGALGRHGVRPAADPPAGAAVPARAVVYVDPSRRHAVPGARGSDRSRGDRARRLCGRARRSSSVSRWRFPAVCFTPTAIAPTPLWRSWRPSGSRSRSRRIGSAARGRACEGLHPHKAGSGGKSVLPS